jgi:hypothetical protein
MIQREKNDKRDVRSFLVKVLELTPRNYHVRDRIVCMAQRLDDL